MKLVLITKKEDHYRCAVYHDRVEKYVYELALEAIDAQTIEEIRIYEEKELA